MSGATGNYRDPQSSTSVQQLQSYRQFEYSEILSATNNFDVFRIIGRGGFGTVYKGTIFNGSTHVDAAFKRLVSLSGQGNAEFLAEMEIHSQLHNSHIVPLIGYCIHGNEMILVSEYMTNGTLNYYLHESNISLTWTQRLAICLGAARGLNYLHTALGSDLRVIHRDIKSANILLDDSWEAKISDFGSACKEGTDHDLVKGTFGYIDPEYVSTGMLSKESDIYSFGVVMSEVLSGRPAVDKSLDEEETSLAIWVPKSIKNGNLEQIVDSRIKDEISPDSLKIFSEVAYRCLSTSRQNRPTIADVVASLEDALARHEKPQSLQTADHGDSKQSSSMSLDTSEVPAELSIQRPSLKVFTYADLETTTSCFRRHMPFGCGGFRQVMFVGWVDENTFAPSKEGVGLFVAVKRYKLDISQEQWLGYVSLLERLDHENIVSLLGYCMYEHKYFLVYKYMQDRSFDRFLFGDKNYISEPLSLQTRVHILIGVASGITYLHSLKDQVVCGVVRSSDILLDQDLNAKLGNFGLTIFGHKHGDTIFSTKTITPLGYIDQHYFRTGSLSVKTDIYGFGAVLLETLTGLPAWDMNRPVEHRNLVNLATPFLANISELHRIMDPRLKQKYPVEGAFKCASLALRCVADEPKDRPSSKEVLKSLKQIFDELREGQP